MPLQDQLLELSRTSSIPTTSPRSDFFIRSLQQHQHQQQQQQKTKNCDGRGKNKMDMYEPMEVIGYGSFGKITKIRRKSDGNTNLVWKELQYGKMSDFEKRQIVSEVNILRTLSLRNHPCLVRYFDKIIDNTNCKVFIVMEHCSNGDLGSYIQSHRNSGTYPNESFVWKILGQISSGLAECHRHWRCDNRSNVASIIHRDLKPANILLDRFMNAKICDFGLATEMTNNDVRNGGIVDPQKQRRRSSCSNDPFETAATVTDEVVGEVACGTPLYMAPERIRYSQYDERSDIWSLGCIIYELVSLRPPFEAKDERELTAKINSDELDEIPRRYSNELNNTCTWMLCRDIRYRPRVEDILGLPQLQFILREIRCLIQECQLDTRRASFHQQLNCHLHRMHEQENELKLREARLREMEHDLRHRERQLMSREGHSVPQTLRQKRHHEMELLDCDQVIHNLCYATEANGREMPSQERQPRWDTPFRHDVSSDAVFGTINNRTDQHQIPLQPIVSDIKESRRRKYVNACKDSIFKESCMLQPNKRYKNVFFLPRRNSYTNEARNCCPASHNLVNSHNRSCESYKHQGNSNAYFHQRNDIFQ